MQPLEQHIARRLQVDHEIRRRHVLREQIEQALVDEQFVVVEIEVRVDAILLEDVVADRDLCEKIGLSPVDELPMPIQEIEQLRLQCRAWPVGIEIGEERVLLIFANERRVEPRRETFGQGGFAGADRAVDRDVSKVQPVAQCTAPCSMLAGALKL